jgi:hypothetical protein
MIYTRGNTEISYLSILQQSRKILRVFGDMVLRRIFEPKRDQVKKC